jgi:serine/threonine protein kinase
MVNLLILEPQSKALSISFGSQDLQLFESNSRLAMFTDDKGNIYTSLYNPKAPFESLANFQQIDTIGTGTFGRVFLTKNIVDNKYYAMKVMRKRDIVRLRQVEHVLNEKNILSSLDHPFIMKLFATFADTRNLYMCFEFIPGGEMFAYLRTARRFNVNTARFYAAEIVAVLEYLHSRSIVYRDLKPENVLLDQDGHIKLVDFGFAKIVTDRTWTLCGTPEYMAPEIIQTKGHNKAVDWWSLGVLIYEMLVGYPPFTNHTPFGIYDKILSGKIDFPSSLDATTVDLLKGLLKVDKSHRLGNLLGGSEDVKNHPWFASINWNSVKSRQLKPPIIPEVLHPGDIGTYRYVFLYISFRHPMTKTDFVLWPSTPGNFSKYPPASPDLLFNNTPDNDPFKHLFKDFDVSL